LFATSTIIGLKETSDGKSGIVWLRTKGVNQHGATVLEFVRWIMLRRRTTGAASAEGVVPELANAVRPETLGTSVPRLAPGSFDTQQSGATWAFEDYQVGEVIDHLDGTTIEDAEHQMATRLF